MVLPEASAPPAVGVKVNVAATPALAATRSAAATANVFMETAPPITPDATQRDTQVSALVCTVTEPPAVGVSLMINPVSVTVTAVLAAIAESPVFMTMELVPGAAADNAAPSDTAADGAGLVAKKPGG